MTQYKLVLADDHQVVINGLISMLETENQLHIEQTTNQLTDLIPSLHLANPDLLILDINMQGAHTFTLIPEIKKAFPNLKIITFTSYDAAAFRKEAVRLGIDGFVTKNAEKSILLRTIYKVLSVDNHPELVQLEKEDTVLQQDKFSIKNTLSKRELEILLLVAQGNNSQQIAEQLFLSKHTIQWHRKKIIAKLGLKSASEMIQFAYKHGLV